MKKLLLLLAIAISIFSCKYKVAPAKPDTVISWGDSVLFFDSASTISTTFSLSSEQDEALELRNRLNFLEREVAYMKGDIEKANKHLQKKTSNGARFKTQPAYRWKKLTLDDMHWDVPEFGREYWDTAHASTGQLIYDFMDSVTKEQNKWWDENKNWIMKDSSENPALDSFIRRELKPDSNPLWKGEGLARGSYRSLPGPYNPWMGSTTPGGGQRKLYNPDGSVFDLDSVRTNQKYADSAINHMLKLIDDIETRMNLQRRKDSIRNAPQVL